MGLEIPFTGRKQQEAIADLVALGPLPVFVVTLGWYATKVKGQFPNLLLATVVSEPHVSIRHRFQEV